MIKEYKVRFRPVGKKKVGIRTIRASSSMIAKKKLKSGFKKHGISVVPMTASPWKK